jgi:hypothetical protein
MKHQDISDSAEVFEVTEWWTFSKTEGYCGASANNGVEASEQIK